MIKKKHLKQQDKRRQLTCKGKPIKLSAEFSAETMQDRRKWRYIFKVLNEKNLQQGIIFPASLSFRKEGEKKSFLATQTKRVHDH